MPMSRANLLHFFRNAGRLKSEPRRGWAVRLELPDPESVADHSYRVALMTMAYSDKRGLDTEKALRIALLHDIPEAIVGDSMPGERTPSGKRRLESRAMRTIARDLPPALAELYLEAWEEYEQGTSPEAKLVKQLDKVEMAVQATEYRERYPGKDVKEFMSTARKAVRDPELLRVIDEVDA